MIWLGAERSISLLGTFAILVVVAQVYGPDTFGSYQWSYSFVFLIFILSQLGLGGITVRELVRNRDREGVILGSVAVIRIMGVTVAAAITTPVVALVNPEGPFTMMMVVCFTVAAWFQFSDVIDWWFQSRVESRYVAIAKFSGFIASASVKIAIILNGFGVLVLASATVIETALAFAVMALFYFRRRTEKAIRFDWKTAWHLLKEGAPLMLATVAVAIYHRVDQLMLGKMLGMEDVGHYSSAVIIAEAAFFIPTVLAISYFPAIITAQKKGDEIDRLMGRLYRLGVRLGYIFALPITLTAPWIIMTAFGNDYEAGIPALRWLAWTGVFVYLGSLRGQLLIAAGYSYFYLMAVSLGCVLNVFLNLVLIPTYGGTGAAVASLISYWMAAHGSSFLFAPVRADAWRMTRALFLVDDVTRMCAYFRDKEKRHG